MVSSTLVDRARSAAAEALKDYTRHNGTPFIGHPDAVAKIVADEIGSITIDENIKAPADCIIQIR